jgi:hypothetical protein
MTSPASPPNRRRRRIVLTLAFVLVLASTALWWYWPRIDERFVGKWKVTTDDTTRSFGSFWLKEDGTGLVFVREPRGNYFVVRSYAFDWRVEGRTFAVLVPSKSGFAWWDRAMGHAYKYTKNPIFLGRDRYAIDHDDAATVQLTGPPTISRTWILPAVFSLTRLPE